MGSTEANLNREHILNKSREILESYNRIYNESFESQIADFKKAARKIYNEKAKKLKKQNKKINDSHNRTNHDHDHGHHHCCGHDHNHVYSHDHDSGLYEEMQSEYEFEEFFNNYFIDKMYEVKQATYNIWKGVPLGDLENKSVEQFFNDINDLDLLIEVLHIAAIECDDDVPGMLLDKLYSFGEEAMDKVADSMLDDTLIKPYIAQKDNLHISNSENADTSSTGNEDNESFLIPFSGIKILGGWKTEKAAYTIIDFLGRLSDISSQSEFSEHKEDDNELEGNEKYLDPVLFYEVAREALINTGEAAIRPLIHALEKTETYYEYHEYLAMALADIGKDYKTEEIYTCLKKMFRKHHNKMVMAYCLGQYGDGRAIPSLRGYAERNIDDIDMDTLYAFNSAIEELGGNMNDIIKNYYQ